MGLAIWVRAVLPVIMGSPIPQGSPQKDKAPAAVSNFHMDASSIQTAFAFLDELLAVDKPEKKGAKNLVNRRVLESARTGVQFQVCADTISCASSESRWR